MQAVIFDIDGTIADNQHRQHLLQSHVPNWDAFFEKTSEDRPNAKIIELYDIIRRGGEHKMLLVSGRPRCLLDDTALWLAQHNIFYDELYFRKDGDRRPDYEVKKDILKDIWAKGYDVSFVVDDRTKTVSMWREHGLLCLQCAQHDY